MDFQTQMIEKAITAALATGEQAPASAEDVTAGASFVIPVVVPIGVETGDGRSFAAGSLTSRDLPLSLLWQEKTGSGHDGSYVVGRIESVEFGDDGSLINGRGVFDTGVYGREAERLVRAKMLRGISADMDKFEGRVEDGQLAEKDPSVIKNDAITITSARLMSATLVPKPAFSECTIELVTDEPQIIEEDVPDGEYVEEDLSNDSEADIQAAIAASAAPLMPPADWFANPKLNGPTPITVDDDGRVFGHIAAWDTPHIGMAKRTPPPRSKSNYKYFRTGVIRTAEGSDVAVGQLTLAGGHADLSLNMQDAVKHYDDTASAVADVAAGEDQFGIWIAGALRPDVTPLQVRVLRASAPSGDWRPVNGSVELCAVCQVNVPGFPVARALVAGGQVQALVAAGANYMAHLRQDPLAELSEKLEEVTTYIEMIKSEKLLGQIDAASFAIHELETLRQEKLQAELSAALVELEPLETEVKSKISAELFAAEEVVRSLKVQTPFEEAKHPRHSDGKFREVLAKISDLLGNDHSEGASKAKASLSKAADAEDSGDDKSIAENATAAREALNKAIEESTDDAQKAKLQSAKDELDKTVNESGLLGKMEQIAFKDLPAPVQNAIESLYEQAKQNVDPKAKLESTINKVEQWVRGQGFQDPVAMAAAVERLLRNQVKTDG